VLQEIFPSETSVYADVLLPGVSFAEKTGTFTNTERRVQIVHKAIEPMGEARPDWQITADISKRIIALGGREVEATPFSGWSYNNTSEIMAEIGAVTPSYAGVTHNRLEGGERLQWPVTGLDHAGTPVLHVEQFTRGKGRFAPIDHIVPAEMPDNEFPVLLSTGRVLYHWHGGEMTRRTEGLILVYDQALVEVNPDNALEWNVHDGTRLRITSRRGCIEAEAWVTDRVPP
jgi:formate dehydrogenase major subunit/formate dehydrogenase alpha subunit